MGGDARLPKVPGRILIVDDDERQRTALAAILVDGDYETQMAADGQEALERLESFDADVIVSDLVMPRMDGFELLRRLKKQGDLTPAIALTAFGSIEKALSAVHDLKAFWFLEKPVEPRAFKTLLERAIHYKRSLQKTDELKRDLSCAAYSGTGGNLPGHAADLLAHQAGGAHFGACIDPWRERHRQGVGGAGNPQVQPPLRWPFHRDQCRRLARDSGGERVIRPRKGRVYGAMERSAGVFEQAHGGTLLLDEIGEMPQSIQPKLLRVIEDLRVRRLGGKHEIAVDARILAATSRKSERICAKNFTTG